MNDAHRFLGRRWRAAMLAVPAAAAALLVAGCGGGSSSSPRATSSSALAGSRATGSPYQQALAYAQCLRTHGAPSYPDPQSNGQFDETPQNQADFDAPQSAFTACANVRPEGQPRTPQQQQQGLEQGLKMAACLRSHGFPDTEDPTSGGRYLIIPPGVDPQSAQWKSAVKTCRKLTGFGTGSS